MQQHTYDHMIVSFPHIVTTGIMAVCMDIFLGSCAGKPLKQKEDVLAKRRAFPELGLQQPLFTALSGVRASGSSKPCKILG